jgi:hypothetical protein
MRDTLLRLTMRCSRRLPGVTVYNVDARAAREYWSHDAVIRVYDESGNVIETHEHAGEFKEW